jgi:hypothetical protein
MSVGVRRFVNAGRKSTTLRFFPWILKVRADTVRCCSCFVCRVDPSSACRRPQKPRLSSLYPGGMTIRPNMYWTVSWFQTMLSEKYTSRANCTRLFSWRMLGVSRDVRFRTVGTSRSSPAHSCTAWPLICVSWWLPGGRCHSEDTLNLAFKEEVRR